MEEFYNETDDGLSEEESREIERWRAVKAHVKEFFKDNAYGKDFYNTLVNEVCGGNKSAFDTDALRMANKAGRQEIALYLKQIVEGTDEED